jgi:hypothetical protein
MHIGECNPDLHELMTARQCHQAAFISDYNPYSEIIEDSENVKRHGDLLDAVNGLGLDTVLGEGRDIERQWPKEISLLICNIVRITADALGNDIGWRLGADGCKDRGFYVASNLLCIPKLKF